MKKLIFLTAVFFALCFPKQGQAQRCLPGQMGVQLTTGLVDGFRLNPYDHSFGYYVDGSLSWYLKHKNYAGVDISYLEKFYPYKKTDIPVTQWMLGAGYHYTFLSDPRTVFLLSAGVSGMLGYETVNRGNKQAYDGSMLKHSDAFLYGGALSLDAEIYLSNSFVWLFSIRQRMLAGSTVEMFRTQIGTGFKIIIN